MVGGAALRMRFLERVEQRVGAGRLVPGPDQFEDRAAQLGQSRALRLAQRRGAVERVLDAMAVIVAGALEGLGLFHQRYIITDVLWLQIWVKLPFTFSPLKQLGQKIVAGCFDGDQSLATSTIAWANACGASCGRLCPMPPVMVRCSYVPVNLLA